MADFFVCYSLEVPLETKEIYDSVTVICNVKEYNRMEGRVTGFRNTTQLYYLQENDFGVVDIVEATGVKTRIIRKDMFNWVFTFYARLDSTKSCAAGGGAHAHYDEEDDDYDEADCYSGLQGHFAITYDVRTKKRQIEIFPTRESVAVFVSPNPRLNSDVSQDVVVVMDTSGSMADENKLRYGVHLFIIL